MDTGSVEKKIRKFLMTATGEDARKEFERRVNAALNIIWRTARAKRSMTTNSKGRKVSDPESDFGVPVKTGNLQRSIKKEIMSAAIGHVRGRVYQDGSVAPYGKYMEFGTSNIQARPFMRPALDINKEVVKRMLTEPRKKS